MTTTIELARAGLRHDPVLLDPESVLRRAAALRRDAEDRLTAFQLRPLGTPEASAAWERARGDEWDAETLYRFVQDLDEAGRRRLAFAYYLAQAGRIVD